MKNYRQKIRTQYNRFTTSTSASRKVVCSCLLQAIVQEIVQKCNVATRNKTSLAALHVIIAIAHVVQIPW